MVRASICLENMFVERNSNRAANFVSTFTPCAICPERCRKSLGNLHHYIHKQHIKYLTVLKLKTLLIL